MQLGSNIDYVFSVVVFNPLLPKKSSMSKEVKVRFGNPDSPTS
jgi:hypothetical protein